MAGLLVGSENQPIASCNVARKQVFIFSSRPQWRKARVHQGYCPAVAGTLMGAKQQRFIRVFHAKN
jgi:hypothetical protein